MKVAVSTQTEVVAGGRSATSAQPPRATLVPATKVFSSRTPYLIRSSSLPDTPGALLEGLRCYPLSARSQKHQMFAEKPSAKPRKSR